MSYSARTAEETTNGPDYRRTTARPLGVQFYSPKPMDEFQLLELDVDATDDQGNATKVTCKGAVVRCQREPQPNRYRIWVKFIEVPEGTQEHLRCTAKGGGHLCSHCENF